jgi:hypothetical protein
MYRIEIEFVNLFRICKLLPGAGIHHPGVVIPRRIHHKGAGIPQRMHPCCMYLPGFYISPTPPPQKKYIPSLCQNYLFPVPY